VIAAFPEFDAELVDAELEADAGKIQDLIASVRNARSQMNVDSKQPVALGVLGTNDRDWGIFSGAQDYIHKLAQVGSMERIAAPWPNAAAIVTSTGIEIQVVPPAGAVDTGAELTRLGRELEKTQREIDGLDRKLSNPSFVDRAPKDVVAENRQRLADYQDQAAKLRAAIERLG
jgi:valyl-tRNA synthetase